MSKAGLSLNDMPRGQRRGRTLPVWLGLALFLVFLGMVPGNHSDTEDAYLYALRVEQGAAADLLHPHHMAYLPLMRWVWQGALALGYTGRAFPLLVVISAVCGACAAALFARLLQRRAASAGAPAARSRDVVPWVLALAFSFGFWRYAMAVEIVSVYLLSALVSLNVLLFHEPGKRRAVLVAVLSALSILLHVFNAVPLLAGAGWYYARCRRIRLAVMHTVLTLTLTAAGFGLLMRWAGGSVSLLGAVHRDHAFGPGSFFRAGVALGQSLLSGNFLFGYAWFAEWLSARLPERMLLEQVFMGRHAPRATLWVPWITLTTCVAAGAGLVLQACRRPACTGCGLGRWAGRVFTIGAADGLFLAWGSLHAVAILWIHPGNPEMWVPLAVPLWYGGSVLLRPGAARGRSLPWLLAAAIFLHNAAGGLWPLASRDGDYLAAKAAPVLAHEQPGDLVLTGDTEVFARYLAYHARAEIRLAATLDPDQAGALLAREAGNVFVLGDVFEPPPALRHRFPARYERTLQVAGAIRHNVHKISADAFGGLYVWQGTGRSTP